MTPPPASAGETPRSDGRSSSTDLSDQAAESGLDGANTPEAPLADGPIEITKHDLASHDARAPLFFIVLLLLASVYQVNKATAPVREAPFALLFSGQNAARYALAGRNYQRDGFMHNGLAPSFRAGEAGTDETRKDALYLHHPPAAPLLVGASFERSEESEEAATLPFLILGLLVPLLIALVTRPIAGGAAGAFAAVLYACSPMTALYGTHVDPQGPVLLVPLLLTVWAFARYQNRGRAVDLLLLLVFLLLALCADWPGVFLAFSMAVLLFGRLRRGERRGILLAPVLALAFMAGFVAWIHAIGRSPMEALFASKDIRGWSAFLGAGDVPGLFEAVGRTFLERVSIPILGLAALAFIAPLTRGVRIGGAGFGKVLGLLLLVGGIHILLFPAGAAVHDYWSYMLLLPIAIAGGAVIESLRRFLASRQGVGFSIAVSVAICAGCWFVGNKAATAEVARLRADPLTQMLPHLGRIVREQTRPTMRLATNLGVNPGGASMLVLPAFTYYSDRSVVGEILTEADLQAVAAANDPPDTYLYFPTDPPPPILKELYSRDPKHRRIEVPLPAGGLAKTVKFTLFDLRP